MSNTLIRVLSVEDNHGDARLILEMLRDAQALGWNLPSFRVEWVKTLQAALDYLDDAATDAAPRPDVILADLNLPDSKSRNTFTALRAHADNIPIVVLTEQEDEILAIESVRAGAQDYLFKRELSGSLLAHALSYAIERHRAKETLQKAHKEASDVQKRQVGERTAELAQVNQELQQEVSAHKATESSLYEALQDSEQRQTELSMLLKGAHAVLEQHEFTVTARAIFDTCKDLIGATSGYVALLSEDGAENEVLFLESGGLPCTVDPSLPMPIRGLRSETYHTGKAAYHNDFPNSHWVKFMPEGHVEMQNVLFAPLTIAGDVVGLLGLANKPQPFTETDAYIATAFGELAAIALINSRVLDALEESETRFRELFNHMSNGVIVYEAYDDGEDFIIKDINRAGARISHIEREDVIGHSVQEIYPNIKSFGLFKVLQQVWQTGIPQTHPVANYEDDQRSLWTENYVYKLPSGEVVAVFNNVTARKQAEDGQRASLTQALHATQALQKTNAELQQLAYAISHDLAAPLRVVKYTAQKLDRDQEDLLNAEAHKNLTYIIQEIDWAQRLIEDLKKYSRVRSRNHEFETVKCETLLEQVLARLQLTIEENNAVVTHTALPAVTADVPQLMQLFQNLIENAIKYYDDDGSPQIHIAAKERDHAWVFSVQDNGIGIGPQHFERIFEIFQRLHTKNEYDGTGVGLAICKRIVERHGGEIWVESDVRQGSTFYFTLPKQQPAPSPSES